MSDFDFELGHLVYSFSALNAFETCQYSFKLNYIDVEPKSENFFGEFGSLIHHVLESYWRRNIDKDEMIAAFEDAYPEFIVTAPPPFPAGMEEKYYNDALDFLEKFSYDRDLYEIIAVEGKYEVDFAGIKLTVRPDLILREISTGKVIMFDFKTSKPVKGKKQVWDEAKIKDYKKQTLLYAHFFEKATGIKVDKIILLFVRLNKDYEVEITETSVNEMLQWIEKTVQLIQWEDEFPPHVDNYFCANICSVRNSCKFWRDIVYKNEYIPE